MTGYRKVSDPVLQSRLCNECRAHVVGFTELGLVTWLDVTPITLEMEAIYHKVGRPTYQMRPRSRRTAWVDWRNPGYAKPPSNGFLLVAHPHNAPGPKHPDPDWVISDYLIVNAPSDQEPLF